MCFNLLNLPLLNFFFTGYPENTVNLEACQMLFPKVLTDIKSIREKIVKFDSLFKQEHSETLSHGGSERGMLHHSSISE